MCAAAALVACGPAAAAASDRDLTAYARARVADANGASVDAARGYALALAARPDDAVIAIRAYREGLASGDIALARRAGKVLVRAGVAPADQAILALADAVVADDRAAADAALKRLTDSPLAFLSPMLRGWLARDAGPADMALVEDVGEGAAFTRRYAAENRALLLLATGRDEEGVAALRALLGTGQPSRDLRLNAAELLGARGKDSLARSLLAGDDPVLAARSRSLDTRATGDARFGISRAFARLGADLSSEGTEALAITLGRAALLLDPRYDRARLILADALSRKGAGKDARAVLAAIPRDSIFADAAQGVEIAILTREGDIPAALAVAERIASAPGATGANARNYADLLSDSERHADAARAYGVAIERGGAEEQWVLHLQRAGALDEAGQWSAALAELRRAAALAPEEPAVLNYLGYAQVEHGQNLAEATRILEKASRLSPEDPAVTDSLGWAYFQQGQVARALPLLERAARGQPADPTIREHLGDAYWRAGRRYEARYAWQAAGTVAEGKAASRIAGKLASGLAATDKR